MSYIWIPIAILIVAIIVGSLILTSVHDRRSVARRQETEPGLSDTHQRAERNLGRFRRLQNGSETDRVA
jgi:hypothetical protein